MILSSTILFALAVVMFASVIFMHLSHKNASVIFWYALQSGVVVILLAAAAWDGASLALLVVALAVCAVKVIAAPHFFRHLIDKHQLKFSASTYLNTPLTLIVLSVLTSFAGSYVLRPLTLLAPEHDKGLSLTIAMMLVAIFLIINRRGVLSQMIGVLSLENAIVLFAYLAGLESSPGLQMGIIFNIFIWLVIAVIFASMIYEKFGSLDTEAMRNLKEE